MGLSACACGGPADAPFTRRCAVAVEMIHVYSLVHDDLPAMDDDELRRGRPTTHARYGEAMAILVGDALLTRALGILAEADPEAPTSPAVAELARGAGMTGMVAGQVADMDLCALPEGMEGLRYIHLRKTAALLRSAARLGAISAGADPTTIDRLGEYAVNLGLAFQLVDDLLDVSGTAEELGKTPGKDAQSGKRTHREEIGRDKAEALAETLTNEAIRCLEPLGPPAQPLRELADLLSRRNH